MAKVNSEIITLSSVHSRFRVISEQVNASDSQNQLMERALNSIIEERLQVQEAKKSGLEVSEESINKAFAEIKKNNNIDDQQFLIMLQSEGRSLEAYKNIIRDQILVSKIIRMHMGQSFVVTKRQIKKYYDQHQKEYWEQPKAKARHILFIIDKDTPKKDVRLKTIKAQEILDRIRAGEDFSELAKKYSEDVSAHLGGDIGVVEKGMMVREFEEAVFRLKATEVSNIVTTRYGLHIIKCDEAVPGFFKTLNNVKDEIRNLLRIQNQQKVHQKWISKLKKNAYIEVSLFDDHSEHRDPRSSFSDSEDPEPKSPSLSGDKIYVDGESRIAATSKVPLSVRKYPLRQKGFGNIDSLDYKLIMKKLKYFKMMRNNNKISESEYRNKKHKLLKNF